MVRTPGLKEHTWLPREDNFCFYTNPRPTILWHHFSMEGHPTTSLLEEVDMEKEMEKKGMERKKEWKDSHHIIQQSYFLVFIQMS